MVIPNYHFQIQKISQKRKWNISEITTSLNISIIVVNHQPRSKDLLMQILCHPNEALHDNLHGIKKPNIRCFAHHGSVKRISGLIYEEIRGVLKVFPENVICDINRTELSTVSVF